MMPTITIDDEVFAFLKGRAEPFVDTPNAVLRRELGLASAKSNRAAAAGPNTQRLRRDATGLGDEDRYLRGKIARIYVDGRLWKSSGVRSPRGADLNQIQTWIADEVGSRHEGNARLIHNLRVGVPEDRVENVRVVIEDQRS